MTNADVIRIMNDDQLAELMAMTSSCALCVFDCKVREDSSLANCKSYWKKWLQSETKLDEEKS